MDQRSKSKSKNYKTSRIKYKKKKSCDLEVKQIFPGNRKSMNHKS